MNYKDFPLKEEELKVGFKYSYTKLDKSIGFDFYRTYDCEIIGQCFGNFDGYDNSKINDIQSFLEHDANKPMVQIIESYKYIFSNIIHSFSMVRKDLYDILYEDFKLKDEYRKYKYEQ